MRKREDLRGDSVTEFDGIVTELIGSGSRGRLRWFGNRRVYNVSRYRQQELYWRTV